MKGLPSLLIAGLLLTGCQSAPPPDPPEGRFPDAAAGGGAKPGLSDYHRRRLQRLGLENPEQDLAADLAGRPALIEAVPVLGGRMYFVADEIHVLTGKWVLATFEDGHIRGHMLLEYNVNEGGDIHWRPLISDVD